jgi:hypothetical protein
MAHVVDSCDIIDLLEESVTTHRPVAVALAGGQRFTDRVRDVVTQDGQDFVEFRDHGRYPVKDVLECARGEPAPESYAGKR